MVASGLPIRNGNKHAGEICTLALHLLSGITDFRIRHLPDKQLQLRIGIHSGKILVGHLLHLTSHTMVNVSALQYTIKLMVKNVSQ